MSRVVTGDECDAEARALEEVVAARAPRVLEDALVELSMLRVLIKDDCESAPALEMLHQIELDSLEHQVIYSCSSDRD